MPCLTDLLADGVVSAAEWVKRERVQLSGIDIAVFVKHRFVCQHADYLADNVMTVNLRLVLNNFALKRLRKFLYNGSVYLFTAVRPLRSNLSVILFPEAMSKKSAASM